jgi:hypothetical protein
MDNTISVAKTIPPVRLMPRKKFIIFTSTIIPYGESMNPPSESA